MKKVGAVVVGVLVSLVLLSQSALAGTSVYVGVSTPGLYFQASSVQPSPHHVWVGGHYYRDGHRRVWAPGHWRYAPPARTVYVPAHPRPYRACAYADPRRGYDRGPAHHGDRFSGNGRESDRRGYTERNGSRRD